MQRFAMVVRAGSRVALASRAAVRPARWQSTGPSLAQNVKALRATTGLPMKVVRQVRRGFVTTESPRAGDSLAPRTSMAAMLALPM